MAGLSEHARVFLLGAIAFQTACHDARASKADGSGASARETTEPAQHTASVVSPASAPPAAPANMVFVPAGERRMDLTPDPTTGRYTGHAAHVDAFFLDRTEVSAADFMACVAAGQCVKPQLRDRKCNYLHVQARANHPMNCVAYAQAARFCSAQNKRMPSASEWEYAARGTDSRAYPWGDDDPIGRACWAGDPKNAKRTTCPVGSFPEGKSPFGALDMAGNLAEWTSTQGEDEDHSSNVVAGGSYLVDPMEDPPARTLRADTVFAFGRSDEVVDIGFRCARDVAVRD